jgi:hypothetical protein
LIFAKSLGRNGKVVRATCQGGSEVFALRVGDQVAS